MRNNHTEKRKNPELEQTFMRLVLVIVGVIYAMTLVAFGLLDYDYLSPIMVMGYLYIAFAVIIVFQVLSNPTGGRWRHTLHMSLDIIVVSLVIHSFGQYGVPFFATYLWLTVGNGFRYGYKELILCALLSLISFIVVFVTTPFWKSEILLTMTCMILLSVIPLYVAIMLKRLQFEKQRAESANREKSRFLANISHELRTPLNAVIGFSGLLDKTDDDSEKSRYIKRIQESSGSLVALVEDVLDFSRIETGHVELAREKVNVYSLVVSIKEMFDAQLEKNNVGFVLDVSPRVPSVLTGDTKRLRQVVVNLVGNAVKFTKAGNITLGVSLPPADQSESILVEVVDTGEGIPADVQPYIFDRFRQADDSARRQHGGAGLGTAIAKHLVELMGGDIGFESEYGKGSRFWFRIPLKRYPGEQDECPSSMRNMNIVCVTNDTGRYVEISRTIEHAMPFKTTISRLSERQITENKMEIPDTGCVIADCRALSNDMIARLTSCASSGDACFIAVYDESTGRKELLDRGYDQIIASGHDMTNALIFAANKLDIGGGNATRESMRIPGIANQGVRLLVAEDSEMNRQVMKGMLDLMGVGVAFANSGAEALRRLVAETFNMLIVDIQMPGMSGFEVISRYKSSLNGNAGIPIVVVTGDVTLDVQNECHELGVAHFLAKPVETDRLRAVLSELLKP